MLASIYLTQKNVVTNEQKRHKPYQNDICKSYLHSIHTKFQRMNFLVKRQKFAKRSFKNFSTGICYIQVIHFLFKYSNDLKVKDGKRYTM